MSEKNEEKKIDPKNPRGIKAGDVVTLAGQAEVKFAVETYWASEHHDWQYIARIIHLDISRHDSGDRVVATQLEVGIGALVVVQQA